MLSVSVPEARGWSAAERALLSTVAYALGVALERADALARLEEQRDALERRTAELARSNRDLEQFAFVAAHDMQEPLRTIVSFSQLLEARHGHQLPEGARRYLTFTTRGALRLKVLVDDLLAYASLNAARPALQETAAASAARDAAEALDEDVRAANATVDVAALPIVLADPGQLTLVFRHLIGNAVKFRRDHVPPVVRVTAEREENAWHVQVHDNGVGIDGAYLERIFGLFQRLHTKDRYGGSGLGLATCRTIVEGHGGRIWATSTLGEGSTFHFTLPVEEARR